MRICALHTSLYVLCRPEPCSRHEVYLIGPLFHFPTSNKITPNKWLTFSCIKSSALSGLRRSSFAISALLVSRKRSHYFFKKTVNSKHSLTRDCKPHPETS